MQWSAINLLRQVRAATEMLIHEVHCYTAQSTALCCQPQTNSLRCMVLTLRWSCRSMTPTIYDIARVAGVSKSTVSRVLNKQTNISPEALEKVQRAIDELQYQPNKLARALTSSGFDAIMVISTRSTKTTAGNPFFSEVLHAITAKAEEEGFDVILQTSRSTEDDLQKCESKIKQKMIKGIIMLSSPADETFFERLDKYDIPVVVIGKVEGQYTHVYSVDTDNYRDSIALTDALIDSGHQNIACLHAPLE